MPFDQRSLILREAWFLGCDGQRERQRERQRDIRTLRLIDWIGLRADSVKIHFCHNVHRWHISNRVLAVHLLVKPLMDFCHSGWVGLWQAQQLQLARRATAGRHQNHLRHQHFWRCLAERYLKRYWNKELFKCKKIVILHENLKIDKNFFFFQNSNLKKRIENFSFWP